MNPTSLPTSKPNPTDRRFVGLVTIVLAAAALLSACGDGWEDSDYRWHGWRYQHGLAVEGRRTHSASASSDNSADLPEVGSSYAYLTFNKARDGTQTIAFETRARFVCDNRWDCPIEVSFDTERKFRYSGRINVHGDAIVIDKPDEMDHFYAWIKDAESIKVRLIFEGRIVSYWFDVRDLDIDDWWR